MGNKITCFGTRFDIASHLNLQSKLVPKQKALIKFGTTEHQGDPGEHLCGRQLISFFDIILIVHFVGVYL